jgi:disulfide bond formation protein DsbB
MGGLGRPFCMLSMKQFVQHINALIIIILSGVLTGAYIVQIRFATQGCPLCILQRAAMIGVALGEMLNLRFGIRNSHYGLSFYSALFGAAVSLKQLSLHFCPGSSPYPIRVWGTELYVWALIVFVSVMMAISTLHFLTPLRENKKEKNVVTPIGWIAMGFLVLITFCNLLI